MPLDQGPTVEECLKEDASLREACQRLLTNLPRQSTPPSLRTDDKADAEMLAQDDSTGRERAWGAAAAHQLARLLPERGVCSTPGH